MYVFIYCEKSEIEKTEELHSLEWMQAKINNQKKKTGEELWGRIPVRYRMNGM